MNSPHFRCLVAEDQAIIALELAADLEEIGIAIAGPFTSCEQALAWTEHDTPDLALLDYKLKDGACTELARAMLRRGVPVVIYSGMPKGSDLPGDLRSITWVEKPVAHASLIGTLLQAARGAPLAQSA